MHKDTWVTSVRQFVNLHCTALRDSSWNTVDHHWLEKEPDNQPACRQAGSSAVSQLVCHSLRPQSGSALTFHFHFPLISNQTHVEKAKKINKKYQTSFTSKLIFYFSSKLSDLMSFTDPLGVLSLTQPIPRWNKPLQPRNTIPVKSCHHLCSVNSAQYLPYRTCRVTCSTEHERRRRFFNDTSIDVSWTHW